MKVRDRIRELRRVKASELRPHPRNWRTHPESQQNALRGVLAEVGYADALLARELPDGSLGLVDGHLRAETTPDSEVPVLVLDITEEEADLVLATLDPLAGMAEANNSKLESLLDGMNVASQDLQGMLDSLLAKVTNGKGGLEKYTQQIKSPVYKPSGKKPKVKDLADTTKTNELVDRIEQANVPEAIKDFLKIAAQRHTKFDFGRIAEYYAQSTPEVQSLFEDSALVIIDFEQAIENGFVQMTEQLGKLVGMENGRWKPIG